MPDLPSFGRNTKGLRPGACSCRKFRIVRRSSTGSSKQGASRIWKEDNRNTAKCRRSILGICTYQARYMSGLRDIRFSCPS